MFSESPGSGGRQDRSGRASGPGGHLHHSLTFPVAKRASLRSPPKLARLLCAWSRMSGKARICTGVKQSAKFKPLPRRAKPKGQVFRVRLMFENSTVCHSRRISLLCPVDHGCQAFWGLVVVVDGFFDNDSDNFCQCRLSGISFSWLCFGGVGVLFSTESLILAQDERWRRA